MHNNQLSACAGILLGFASLSAMADYGSPYFSAKGGLSQMEAKEISNVNLLAPGTPSTNNMQHSSYVYGGALGYQFNGYEGFSVPVRFEGEYMYRSPIDYNANPIMIGGTTQLTSEAYTQTVLGNLYIDIPVIPVFQFFVGGGGGISNARTHSKVYNNATGTLLATSITDRDAASWMATAGITVKPAKWLALEASYRYSGLGSIRWTNAATGVDLQSNSYIANEVLVGFRLIMPDGNKPRPPMHQVEYQPAPVAPPVIAPVDTGSERKRRQKAAGDVKKDK